MSDDFTLGDLALLDALGILGDDESACLRKLLSSAGGDALEEAALYREATTLIADSLEPVEPPADVKGRVLSAVRAMQHLDESIPVASRTIRAVEGSWTTAAPGVRVKKLSFDSTRGALTLLMKMEAGSILPPHDHRGTEESYVVDGRCRIGAVSLSKGDFHQVDAGAHHGNVVTDIGCTLLLVVDAGDYRAA